MGIMEKKMETIILGLYYIHIYMYTKVTMWEFPKIRGTILGVPIIRTIVF